MCDKYTYTSGGQQLFLNPSGETRRKGCVIGEKCLNGTPCITGTCPNVVPGSVPMLTNANQDPTQSSTQCNDNNSQDVQLGDGTIVKYPTQCFAPILNEQFGIKVSSCGLYDKGGVPLPIPCNDALAEKHGNDYILYPAQGGYPQQPEFVNCQDDPTEASCRPFTFQTKVNPHDAVSYNGNLNVFGYWGATNMWDFPELTEIHPTFNQVIISFFHIAKYNGKLAIKCTMQRYGHESIWDDAPPWSVFPDGYSRGHQQGCDEADSSCNSRSQDCCTWMHNGGGDQNFGIAKLIEDIRMWKSAARPDRPRTVLASFGGGSGANVTDPNGLPATGAFTEPDVVKKDNFVQTVLDFLITWGFDGIDNDYEALGGGTCPIGNPGSVVRKNWEDLYSGLRSCNPGIILTAAPFNNQHLWAFVNSGFFDEIRPQLYNPGGYQIENKKPTPQAPDGAADKWVGLLQNIGRSTKANGRGGYINVPGVLLEASCRSGGGRLKQQCWDMGRLANTIIYLNQQGEFGKPGKMMSVGVWDIAQGQRLTDDSFAAAMQTITIHLGHANTPEPANLKCYYNKIFVDPCEGNECWADCGAKSGGRADGGRDLVNNHCNYRLSAGGYCGDGPAYNQDGSIQCGTRCGDCRAGSKDDGGIGGKPCDADGAYCSMYGYCGTSRAYSEGGERCGKAPDPCDGKTRSNYCNNHGRPIQSQDMCQCECDDGWTGDRCDKKSDPCDGKTRANYCNTHGDPQQIGESCLCKCDNGWSGNRCQTRPPHGGMCTPEECASEQCAPGAYLCTSGVDGCSATGWDNVPGCDASCNTASCAKPSDNCAIACSQGGRCPNGVACESIPDENCWSVKVGGNDERHCCCPANPAQPRFLSNINI